jgi:hypothetical protein
LKLSVVLLLKLLPPPLLRLPLLLTQRPLLIVQLTRYLT